MPIADTSRRLRPAILDKDIDSLHGLGTIPTYSTVRAEATADALQLAHDQMRIRQQAETEKLAIAKAATDAARLAEWEFHNAVLAMKECVRGQFGSDSNEAQAIGFKKKSERKRPKRQAA
ncbi:hypothetical protein VB780_10525 [Leptolyngbya sp. CCNP1308]|uniref:hypothetical protein n=1 Tax=Leptolyngbya sp. CCNP1308 TaxID=3110255 RepID=UPI002B211189|nr:hypothetical protein [Leptolyngbya sp. CCNP1308]MEA5449004.1 hypothetical protein [Leptolyngbya sp. CCNP1308]